jgi:methylated-DNA-protein-cysteine methyltransferase related protein
VTAFPDRVYQLVQTIPYGRVTSYGRLALALGHPRGARRVGWALSRTPSELHLNAHRVVGHDGYLSGGWAFGAPEVQRALLEAEGVEFKPDGRVDLQRFLWSEDELFDTAAPLRL